MPELAVGGAGPVDGPSTVTDEDRNRYGVLLDHAAERGLLPADEYQARLAELADATTVDEMQRIVTELPAFGATQTAGPGPEPGVADAGTVPVPSARRPGTSTGVSGTPPDLDATLWANLTPASSRRRRGNPWLILGVLVVLMLVSLVVLALVASHLAHTHPAGLPPRAVQVLSRLRL